MNTSADINRHTVQPYFELLHRHIETAAVPGNYLLGGKLGLVLYYFSLYEALGSEEYADKCISLVEEVMNDEGETNIPLAGTSFANGTAGLGYILSLLQRSGLAEIDLQEDLKELDESLAAAALKQITGVGRNDYLHGALGTIHYFTTRSTEPPIRKYLETLVKAFCDTAIITEEGLWFPNFIMDEAEKERIDTGVSHGNAGFLLILLNAVEAGMADDRLTETITGGVEFLISRQMETDPATNQHALFPFSVHRHNHEDVYFTQRLAWCYGDLNIILLLYRAAALLHKPQWKELADRLSDATLKRKDESSTLAVDSHFCHGTAGLAQVYHTLHTLTGEEKFLEAYRYWTGQTLTYIEQEIKNNFYSTKEGDLLNGLPGINLVLLSYLCQKQLSWGHTFLL